MARPVFIFDQQFYRFLHEFQVGKDSVEDGVLGNPSPAGDGLGHRVAGSGGC